MHGEYKAPGNKLVMIDFEINYKNNTIYDVQISGDFFLEPSEALNIMNESLNGLPIDSNDEVIKKIIERNLPENTEFIGFSTTDIVMTIKRALLCL
ncbi:MAG: biotin--protein ligase [Candidatus Kinetoplastibacterium crithidii]|nr:MAG: biotin--protein ligase [Candidatus Kinetoplastibacterium crithidii]